MEIKNFRLTNIGRYKEIEVFLAPNGEHSSNVTVFVGNNGSGKTSLLKSIATSLSWLVARIRAEKGMGSPILEDVIRNGANSAAIDIALFDSQGQESNPDADEADHFFQWTVAKSRAGRKSDITSNLFDVSDLADYYRAALSHNDKTTLPLVAFYPVERSVLDIPLKIKNKHSFNQLDGYENSLNQGVDFRRFFEWFREREDSENESGISQVVLDQLMLSLGKDNSIWQKLNAMSASSKDRQLTAVRTAISSFMPDLKNLRVKRKPRLHMAVDKNGDVLNVAQLSQGEKSLMALVGDIARRLAMMNPNRENPLHGDGIVLIDEVDLHLHPKWQRALITRLTTTFPNCQFILSTHSPLVISDNKDILVYLLDNGECQELPALYGKDANSVLLEVMDTDIVNAEVHTQINSLLKAIQNKNFSDAQSLLKNLEQELGSSNLELLKARLLLKKQELRHAQNH